MDTFRAWLDGLLSWGAGEWIGAAGLLLGIVGFGVTIWNIRETTSATRSLLQEQRSARLEFAPDKNGMILVWVYPNSSDDRQRYQCLLRNSGLYRALDIRAEVLFQGKTYPVMESPPMLPPTGEARPIVFELPLSKRMLPTPPIEVVITFSDGERSRKAIRVCRRTELRQLRADPDVPYVDRPCSGLAAG